MLDDNVTMRFSDWCKHHLEDEDLSAELERIKGNETYISDCFYKNLEFGTGGLRGIIGVGTNRMNIYTIRRATQGYANYLNKNFKNPSVSIAYDSRIKSDLFAMTSAEVFAANNIKVHIFHELMPTPSLSFAVRHLNCSGGIVITASHNPYKYNGYKVYGPDGCQITTVAAEEILAEINKVDIFEGIRKKEFEQSIAAGLITYISAETITAYIDSVSKESLCGEEIDKNVSIVYTPLNGAGRYCVTRVLKENGFSNITVVKEQEQPDGYFSTCPYPNPEVREALELGLKYAKSLNSDILLATDPDCDRVGTAVKSDDGYVLLSGNEMGLLLFDYICKRRIEIGKMPQKPILIKTIVTIDMVRKIAANYGVEVIDVLTGFKFIGEQIGLLEKNGEESRYIFGFEESYGYLSGGYVRDKDGVNASLLICEMLAYYKARGLSLLDVLDGLYKKYGFCLNTLHSYTFEGAEGLKKMNTVMTALRQATPKAFVGREVKVLYDYKRSVARYIDGSEEAINLPKSNVLKFVLEGDLSVVVRPSGTEPKLKLYLSVSEENREKAVEMEKRLAQEIEKFGTL